METQPAQFDVPTLFTIPEDRNHLLDATNPSINVPLESVEGSLFMMGAGRRAAAGQGQGGAEAAAVQAGGSGGAGEAAAAGATAEAAADAVRGLRGQPGEPLKGLSALQTFLCFCQKSWLLRDSGDGPRHRRCLLFPAGVLWCSGATPDDAGAPVCGNTNCGISLRSRVQRLKGSGGNFTSRNVKEAGSAAFLLQGDLVEEEEDAAVDALRQGKPLPKVRHRVLDLDSITSSS